MCSDGSGYMTKMAVMPEDSKKTLKIFFFGANGPMALKFFGFP